MVQLPLKDYNQLFMDCYKKTLRPYEKSSSLFPQMGENKKPHYFNMKCF